ncbi:SRPBCC domain-containing protein [Leptospira congkakensis]|uniref:SRPBCC domain-containing protein n=1 Tax=Leptospira congkakensis TaxID=2484932 RepID=A0A4Z1A5W9_9LEPT|nr:SRPBCC domain-containing protein [Leptospira congkakensis]TGL87382.1 SRPBCC domain-containing protein [Leptospira congkakensis]TGL96949.1 SRPBCC domain-containing protein [Leptospira congkakensis]TGL97800.1 SRPBCC domain-containing protein [Leptospira congkakensis]
MNQKILKVERRINADPTKVFQAWLNVEDFAQWFLSGEGIGIESVTMDPRPGGKFLINMSLDGKILPHEGEYIVIEKPHKLVFTWRSHATENRDTLVTVTFKELRDLNEKNSKENQKFNTLVTLIHEELISDIQIKMHNHGWTNILDSLSGWIT